METDSSSLGFLLFYLLIGVTGIFGALLLIADILDRHKNKPKSK
jgi:hypothetical protein